MKSKLHTCNWLHISLFNFFIAAVMGALLRFTMAGEVQWFDYRYMVHAHSHVAVLGWVYMALYALLVHYFLPEEKQLSPFYKKLFWFTELTVVGMAIAFPMQGYAGFSIAFSSLHILASYLFMWRFLKDAKASNSDSNGFRFVRAALWFMLLSTLAIWGMPALIVNGLKGSAIYHAAVQFYLHFQFNGWVLFAILGLFFKLSEFHHLLILKKNANRFFYLLLASSLLTYALAVAWTNPMPALFGLNSLGVVLQLGALVYFWYMFKDMRPFWDGHLSGWTRSLFLIALISFFLKIIIQASVIVPYVGIVAYTIRQFVLGFIHLLLLAMATSFLLAFASHENIICIKKKRTPLGIALLLAGIVITEVLLFGQGVLLWSGTGSLPSYYWLVFGASALMPIGIGLILYSQIREKDNRVLLENPSWKE